MPAPTLGRLDWQPVLTRPDLLADPVRTALRRADTAWSDQCFVAPIDAELADTDAFCTTYAVPLDASANCVVVTGRRGESSTTAACLVLATDRADVNQVVRRHLGLRKLSFAPMSEAVTRTGMAYGGITPLGLPVDWPVLVDEAVAAQQWIVVGSGVRGSKLALPGRLAAELPGAEVLRLRRTAD